METPTTNPFLSGFPININQLPSRQRAIRRIAERIREGVSIAIIGEPRIAKTNLLEHLSSPSNLDTLYGEEGKELIFSQIDCQMLPSKFTQAQFWSLAISPIEQEIQANPDSPLAQSYRDCQESEFDAISVSKLLDWKHFGGRRLVLFLDEFDTLLIHSLGTPEFWANLRALSDWPRRLVLVVSSRYPIDIMSGKIERVDVIGSPYFNLLHEVRLRGFPQQEVETLLGDHFPPPDRQYIFSISGGHPYLLQVAASAMWDEYTFRNYSRLTRHIAVGQQVYETTKLYFSDIWQGWSPAIRKVVTAIALANTPHLLQGQEFQTLDFLKDFPLFHPEIHYLLQIGVIAQDDNVQGGYKLTQGAMMWWLGDKIINVVRDDKAFEQWLLDRQVISGLVARRELRYVSQAAKFVGALLDKGASTLIEAYAKGLVK